MNRYRTLCLVALSISLGANAWAANSLVVESKTVAPGETGVTIGAFVTNDVALAAIQVPLEIREVSAGAGAFTTNNFDFIVQGRVAASGLNDIPVKYFYADPDAINSCSGPVSQTYSVFAITPAGFHTSPDAVVWAGQRLFGPVFGPGSDVTPSFLFTFDVTNTPGQFEIDTACATGAHLDFIDTGGLPVPVDFTKGTVTIASPVCNDRPEDTNCDGKVDVFDVVQAVAVAFRNNPESPPCCATGP